MKKAYFQYYETFENIVQKFKTAEEREAIRAKIINYGLYGTIPETLSEKEEMIWDLIEELIDDQKHRREVNEKNRKTRKAGTNGDKETFAEHYNCLPPEEDDGTDNKPAEEETKAPEAEEKEINDIEETLTTFNEKKRNVTKNNEIERNETKNNDLKTRYAELNRNETNRNELKRKEMESKPAKADDTTTKKRFSPPTLEEVTAYCTERGNSVNPSRFLNYYESKGWKVGRSPMKDWKAAVRTWEQTQEIPKNYTPSRTNYLPDDRQIF